MGNGRMLRSNRKRTASGPGCRTSGVTAVRAIQWCHERRDEIFREGVTEMGFDGSDGCAFEPASLPGFDALRRVIPG